MFVVYRGGFSRLGEIGEQRRFAAGVVYLQLQSFDVAFDIAEFEVERRDIRRPTAAAAACMTMNHRTD